MKPKLDCSAFRALCDMNAPMNRCGILNGTLGCDPTGTGDFPACIDVASETLYALEPVEDGKPWAEHKEEKRGTPIQCGSAGMGISIRSSGAAN